MILEPEIDELASPLHLQSEAVERRETQDLEQLGRTLAPLAVRRADGVAHLHSHLVQRTASRDEEHGDSVSFVRSFDGASEFGSFDGEMARESGEGVGELLGMGAD